MGIEERFEAGGEIAINSRTGLPEAWDEFYNIPSVRQRSLEELTFEGQDSAVHSIPLDNGLSFDFFAKLEPAEELIVTFPGAVPKGKKVYPMFWRVSTFRKVDPALLAFADPTILLDSTQEMRLAWFLGGPDFDPAPLALRVIREAQRRIGAKHVVFVGGSGGGLPALRLSSLMPGSMAYVHEGATNVARSIPRSVERYFSCAWKGWNQDELIQGFPERFNMVRHYEKASPDNFVYFAQSEDDLRFRRDHYSPFMNAMGVLGESGATVDNRRHFVLYKGDIAGHGKVTAAEFRHHFDTARSLWREWR